MLRAVRAATTSSTTWRFSSSAPTARLLESLQHRFAQGDRHPVIPDLLGTGPGFPGPNPRGVEDFCRPVNLPQPVPLLANRHLPVYVDEDPLGLRRGIV